MNKLHICFLLFSVQLISQTYLNTHFLNGTGKSIEISELRKLTFNSAAEQINFHYWAGNIVTENIASLRKITFGDVSLNTPPIAKAGEDQEVIKGEIVQLDGSLSSDPEGDPLTFSWVFLNKPEGSTSVLSDAGIVNPTFVADYAGAFVIELTVNDAIVNSPPDCLTVNVLSVQDAFANLISMVSSLPINSGLKNSLTKKLQQALTKYNQGQFKVAENVLNAFKNEVMDLIADTKLTTEQGRPLVDYANRILSVLYFGLAKSTALVIQIPTQYELRQNSPNPFNPTTSISYGIPKDGIVTLKVYDIMGSEVAVLINENKPAGFYRLTFDGGHLASGIYVCRFNSGNYVSSIKMMLVK